MRYGRFNLVLITTTVVALAAVPAAFASTAGFNSGQAGGTVVVTAQPGETNNVTSQIGFTADNRKAVVVTDTAGITAVGPGCTQDSPTQVTCRTEPGVPGFPGSLQSQSLAVDLGDQADSYLMVLALISGRHTVNGGPGDDSLDGTKGGIDGMELYGDDGNDQILGSTYSDDIFAGPGDDLVRAINGKDLVRGDLGNDRLKGGPQRDKLLGQAGEDDLNGGGARDNCKGGSGDDSAAKCEVEKSI